MPRFRRGGYFADHKLQLPQGHSRTGGRSICFFQSYCSLCLYTVLLRSLSTEAACLLLLYPQNPITQHGTFARAPRPQPPTTNNDR